MSKWSTVKGKSPIGFRFAFETAAYIYKSSSFVFEGVCVCGGVGGVCGGVCVYIFLYKYK